MPNAYAALSAKVRAMYGGRMTAEDYRLLMEKKTLPEAAAFLQAHRGYSRGLAGLRASGIRREALENALREVYIQEYQRIFSFLSLEDKALMRFPVYRAERDAIITAMGRLNSPRRVEDAAIWTGTLQKNSKLKLARLELADSFQDIVEAAEDTIYASALERSAVQMKAPSTAFVDNMMQVTYFAHLYKVLSTHYSGQVKTVLRQSFDQETDLLNLVQFLRLKKHFSQEDVQRYSFPLTCSHRLGRAHIQTLLSAPDYESAFQLVCDGPYGHVFRTLSTTGLEAYLYTLQFRFNQRQLRAAIPTVYTPIAYLSLKEIELRNIISIIECIRYEIKPDSYVTLIGI